MKPRRRGFIISEYRDLPSGHSGEFEQRNGGRRPGDIIVCPQVHISRSIDAKFDAQGAVIGYKSHDFDLTFEQPLTPGLDVVGTVTDGFYHLNNHQLRCGLANTFPYRCTPHDYSGE